MNAWPIVLLRTPLPAVAQSQPVARLGETLVPDLGFWRTRRAAVLLGTALSLALSWSFLATVWGRGTYVDTDDAMRMVQIRDWLAGQAWYDLTAYRMDPPYGVFMHWSRVVDAPIGCLLYLFGLFAQPQMAERLARLVYSVAWQPALVFAVGWTAEDLEGPSAWLPAAALTALSGLCLTLFQPGRIDHDSIQITLFVLALGATLRAFDPRRWKWAALVGALGSLALAVGLEEAPFFAVLFAAPALMWVWRGSELSRALAALGASILLCLPIAFVATVGPSRWGLAACDALSPFHLVALGLGGAACLVLAVASPRAGTPARRLLFAIVAAAVTVAVSGALFPECFGSPYAQMDSLVRTQWLDKVGEARPLAAVIADRPAIAPMLLGPLVFALLASAAAIVRTPAAQRAKWLLILALAVLGALLSTWEVRALAELTPILLFGAIRAAMGAARAARNASNLTRFVVVALTMLPFSPIPYALTSILLKNAAQARLSDMAFACLQPESFAPLAALPPGRTLAPINAGSHLLLYTHDSVFGAPYHRDGRGNRLVLESFRATPQRAEGMVRAAGARYVMTCPGLDPSPVKGSLASALQQDAPPSWLKPVRVADTPFKVYEVAGSIKAGRPAR